MDGDSGDNDTMLNAVIAITLGLGGICALIYVHDYYQKWKQWHEERKSWQAAKRYWYQ